MMSDDPLWVGLEDLGRLTRTAPDPVRAERTRSRCRAELERRRRRSAQAVSMKEFPPLAPVVVFGFCVLYVCYVSALVATAIGLHQVLR